MSQTDRAPPHPVFSRLRVALVALAVAGGVAFIYPESTDSILLVVGGFCLAELVDCALELCRLAWDSAKSRRNESDAWRADHSRELFVEFLPAPLRVIAFALAMAPVLLITSAAVGRETVFALVGAAITAAVIRSIVHWINSRDAPPPDERVEAACRSGASAEAAANRPAEMDLCGPTTIPER